MNTWYYRNGAAQMGPVTDEQMRALVASGAVTAETPVWAAGMAAWTTAGAAGLCAGGAVPPPVPDTSAEQIRRANEALKTIGAGAWASIRAGGTERVCRGCALALRILAILFLICGLFKFSVFGLIGDTATISPESIFGGGRSSGAAFLSWLVSFLSGAFVGFLYWCQSMLLDAAAILLSRRS